MYKNIPSSFKLISSSYHEIILKIIAKNNSPIQQINVYFEQIFLTTDNDLRKNMANINEINIVRNIQNIPFSFCTDGHSCTSHNRRSLSSDDNANTLNQENKVLFDIISKLGYGMVIETNQPIQNLQFYIQNKVLLNIEKQLLNGFYAKKIQHNYSKTILEKNNCEKKNLSFFFKYLDTNVPNEVFNYILSFLIKNQTQSNKITHSYWIPFNKDIKMNQEHNQIHSYINFSKINNIYLHINFENKEKVEKNEGNIYIFGFNVLQYANGMAGLKFI